MRISPERHFDEDIPIDCLLPGRYVIFRLISRVSEEIYYDPNI